MQVRPPYHRPLVGTRSLLTLCSIPLNQGKTEVLPVLSTLDGEYSYTLTLSQPEGADYTRHIGFVSPKLCFDYALENYPVHRALLYFFKMINF